MINKKDISIVIQGPLNPISLERLNLYEDYGQIIISCWADGDISLLSKVYLPNNTVIKINKYQRFVHADCWVFTKQLYTTYSGLLESKTKFSAKVRSDEYYQNLNPLIEKLSQNEEKMICNNIFFKRWEIYPYHISDHLMLFKTDYLRRGLQHFFNCVDKDGDGAIIFGLPYFHGPTENFFSYGFLYGKEIDPVMDKEFMKQHFDVVDVNLLGDYKATFIHGNMTWTPYNPYNKNTVSEEGLGITNIEQL